MSGLTDTAADRLIEAVREAARTEITPRFRSLALDQIDSKSAVDDLVTVADKASEAAISRMVRDILPEARIVGEEAVSADRSILDGVGEPGISVIIDPIDGTWNYANGLAVYGVILAVVEDGQTTMGLLYDPTFDDWVIARKGAGAWYVRPDGAEDQRLSVAQTDASLEELVGYVSLYLYPRPDREKLAATLPIFRRTMSLRCACHEYRVLAQGKVAFGLNGMLNVWDHAAGVLAVNEAGGVARLLDGRDYAPEMQRGNLLLAANPDLWARLQSLWSTVSQHQP